MNIEVFVSPNGEIAFTCHGMFKKAINRITLNPQTGIVNFIFDPDNEEIEMNCTIDEEVCNKIQNQILCVIGYFNDKELVASEYVRFACIM